jgi:hypothetical protein
VRI